MPKLTKKFVEGSLSKEKSYIIWDDEIKGFGCRILPSGYKTYVFHYTSPATKKYSYLKIGVHGNYTVDLARDKAKNGVLISPMTSIQKRRKKLKPLNKRNPYYLQIFGKFSQISIFLKSINPPL